MGPLLGPRGPCLLLLPLIGAAPTASWRLADQRTLGVCLHIYLERDFPQIERIVYPAPPSRSSSAVNGRSGSRVLLDGPGLEADCHSLVDYNSTKKFASGSSWHNHLTRSRSTAELIFLLHLSRLVRCFSTSLARMQYYENFSEFRRLVVALDAVLLELCGAVDLMRHRFLPLLQNLNCIEQVRAEKSSCPYRDRLPPNIWHQLIRLEADSTLCWPLMRQLNCVRDEGLITRFCGEPAQHLFTNISAVFLRHWCLNAGSSLAQIPFILKVMVVLLPLLHLSSFFTNI